ncbi:hypothetical protein CPC08DRAFT_721454 [Agrocybe pediades]|nr:hypothetical protein CPC08DRAFT_721454 [Agrocybe pediades]
MYRFNVGLGSSKALTLLPSHTKGLYYNVSIHVGPRGLGTAITDDTTSPGAQTDLVIVSDFTGSPPSTSPLIGRRKPLEVEWKIQYSVHQTILARHSSFFRDLFIVPQPENTSEAMEDGTPIVQMLTDREKTGKGCWMCCIILLSKSLPSYSSGFHDYSLPTIIAVLRLGHKYQFDRLKSWPGSASGSVYVNHAFLDRDSNDKGKFFNGNEYELLKVAREVGMHSLLLALHLLCIWSCLDVMNDSAYAHQRNYHLPTAPVKIAPANNQPIN